MRIVVVMFCLLSMLLNSVFVMRQQYASIICPPSKCEQVDAGQKIPPCCAAEKSDADSSGKQEHPSKDCPHCAYCKTIPATLISSALKPSLGSFQRIESVQSVVAALPASVAVLPAVPPPKA